MRRTLALACCALCVTFGFVAGAAHVHESAGHHAESRGVHVDHAHLGDFGERRPGPEHRHGHGHGSPHVGNGNSDTRHVAHHDGDAVYLSATAEGCLDSTLHSVPAIGNAGGTIQPAVGMSDSADGRTDRPRDPPPRGRTEPRAPPA